MKKNYMNELENEINIHNIKNKKEILNKYSKRYDFGLEAGFTEEEVERKLGTPQEVVKQYIGEDEIFEKPTNVDVSDEYTVEVKTLSDNIEIVYSNDNKLHVELEDIDEKNYEIAKGTYVCNIAFKKTKFFSLNRREKGIIRVEIPKKGKIGSVILSTTNGDITAKSFSADEVVVNMVSGDLLFDEVEAESFTYHSVSGDASIRKLKCDNAIIDIVSGDLESRFMFSNSVNISTVSGDVYIKDGSIGNIQSTTVSGEVVVNDERISTNVKDYVRGLFK